MTPDTELTQAGCVVLVLAAVDAAAGVCLLAHGIRRGGFAERWVGVALLVSGLGLGSTPWLTDEEPLPAVARSARV